MVSCGGWLGQRVNGMQRIGPEEAARLAELARLRILDTTREEAFDDLVELARSQTGCPVAVITLVDAARGWFKAASGIAGTELPRAQTFCAQAILADRVLEVADATRDARFASLDVVQGPDGLRAYLGAPVTTANGHRIGAICVLDRAPRTFSAREVLQMRLLARVTGQMLETRAAALAARESALDSGRQLAAAAHAGVILETMGDGVVALDSRGRITDANPAACTILGLTLDEMQGRTPADPTWRVIREDGSTLPIAEYPVLIALASGEPVSGAVIGIVPPDGEVRWVRMNLRPLASASGDGIDGMICTLSDITDRAQSRSQLERSTERLSMAMHLARACSFEIRPRSGREAWFSDRLDELVGGPVDPRARISDYIHPDDLPLLRAALRQALRTLEPLQVRFRIGAEGGSGLWCEAYAQVDRGPDGRITRLVGLFKDVSLEVAQSEELQELALRAEAASGAKSAFLANMGHEIRTPLNGVIGLAASLGRTSLTPVQGEMVRLIADSGQSLLRLLNDLLDLSKAEAGRLDLELAPFELGPTIDSASHLLRVRADDKGVAFSVTIDPALAGHVLGDSVRLRQVISNLTSNAVKFTDAGSVVVEARAIAGPSGAERLRVEVRDTGPGFDAATGARLFGRFEQAETSTARRYGGTGLGLSICKSIVELMDGSIGATSQPGVGSCFWFEVPLQRVQPPGPAATPLEAGTGMLEVSERITLLLADDHPVNQRVVTLMLEPFEVDVICADNGAEALELYTATRFDVVLMDMQMPVLDGLEATRAIRALERTAGRRRTPVIVLSANAGDAHVAAGRAAGADFHVAKPVSPDRLVEALDAALALAATPPDLAASG